MSYTSWLLLKHKEVQLGGETLAAKGWYEPVDKAQMNAVKDGLLIIGRRIKIKVNPSITRWDYFDFL